MQKISVPLKAKIIVLFGPLLVGALAFYVYYAIKLFNEDKAAYIYDSTLASVETLGEQVRSRMSEMESLLLPLIKSGHEQIRTQDLTRLKETLLRKEEMYEAVFLVREIKDQQQLLKNKFQVFVHRPEGLEEENYQAFSDIQNAKLMEDLQHSQSKNFTSKTVSLAGSKILEVVKSYPEGILVLRLSASHFFTALAKGKQHYFLLFNENLETILDGGRKDFINHLESSGFDLAKQVVNFQSRPTADVGAEVREFDLSGKGERKQNVLLGIKFLPDFKLWALALIPTNEAFRAARFLIQRSAFLGGLLLSLCVFFGLLFARGLTRPLEKLAAMAQKVAKGEFGITVAIKGRDELSALATTFNYMSKEIEHYIGEMKEKSRLENELYVAQLVQSTFFPDQDWKKGCIEVSGRFRSASECGGDWWGIFHHGPKSVIFICDATGHGVGAALMTATAFCSLRNLKQIIYDHPDYLENPGKILSFMNHAALGLKGEMLMTAVVGVLDVETHIFKYANASHCPPIFFKSKENTPTPEKDQFVPLMEANGARLGHRSDEIYKYEEIMLEKDDAIFFYTDGITEAENAEGKPFGQRRLLKTLIKTRMALASNVVDTVFSDINDFLEGASIKDDHTVVCLKRQSKHVVKIALHGTPAHDFDLMKLKDELTKQNMVVEEIENGRDADVILYWCKLPLSPEELEFLKTNGKKVYVLSDVTSEENIEFILSPFEIRHLIGKNAFDLYGEISANICKERFGHLWGIERYLGDGAIIHHEEVGSSEKIMEIVSQMIEKFDLTTYFAPLKDYLATVSVELVSNAVFDAVRKPSGELKYYNVDRTQSHALELKEKVSFKMGRGEKLMAISVEDNFGGLKRDIILNGILRAMREKMPKTETGGAGLGLYMAFGLSSTLVVNLWDDKRTEVIALFDLQKRQKHYKERVTSFHFFREE
ncbi:MAG: SpoIIE family protein phosphatase [Bdellovibrio sp.]|nr:SpoIIE family protein phosphatase [Bdellovibrio sp.]